MQLLDDLEIVDQRAKFGGRAKLELRALIDVQGLIVVIGLYPQEVQPRPALIKREAIDHGTRIALGEQPMLPQVCSGSLSGIREFAQELCDILLRRSVNRSANRQVEPVKGIRIL